jgi:hypothetical protein
MSQVPRIITGRGALFRRTRECSAERSRLLAEARVRHEAAFRAAPFWGRLLIRFAIAREVRAEMNRIYPPDALYVAGGSR